MVSEKKRNPWPAGTPLGDRTQCACGHYLGSHDGALPHRCWVAGCTCKDVVPTDTPVPSPADETTFPFPEQEGEAPERRFLRVLATKPELRAEFGRTLWLRENGLRSTRENVERFEGLAAEERAEWERRAVAECEAFADLSPQEQAMHHARGLTDQLAQNDAHAKALFSTPPREEPPVQPSEAARGETAHYVHVGEPLCTCGDPRFPNGCLKHDPEGTRARLTGGALPDGYVDPRVAHAVSSSAPSGEGMPESTLSVQAAIEVLRTFRLPTTGNLVGEAVTALESEIARLSREKDEAETFVADFLAHYDARPAIIANDAEYFRHVNRQEVAQNALLARAKAIRARTSSPETGQRNG